jgi:ribosomal protein S12 methylthiotransferase accessory factor
VPQWLDLDREASTQAAHPSSPEALLADPTTSLVADFNNYPPAYDEPKLYHIVASIPSSNETHEDEFPDADEDDAGTVTIVGGCSLDRTRALWKALGEALEREALTHREGLPITFATYAQLHGPALDPNRIPAGTGSGSQDRQTMPMGWVEGMTLPAHQTVYVPAQLVYVPYMFAVGEAVIRAPMSTGAAAGSTREAATFAALAETVERDAFMVSWLKQLTLTKLEITGVRNDPDARLLQRSIEKFRRYHLRPEFYLLVTDLPLYSVMCVLWDATGVGPQVSIGAKASASLSTALLGSLEEAQQLRPWLRSLLAANGQLIDEATPSRKPTSLRERAELWLSKIAARKLHQWLDRSSPGTAPDLPVPTTLNGLLTALVESGCSPYLVDLTSPKVERLGFAVVKAVVPELQPLYLDEEMPDFSWARLERHATRFGSLTPFAGEETESFPHPFL